MNEKNIAAKFQEESQEQNNKPLSEKELSSLIRASKTSSFKVKEIKKEMNNNFKKLSLHEIAKQIKIKNSEENLKKEKKTTNRDEPSIEENDSEKINIKKDILEDKESTNKEDVEKPIETSQINKNEETKEKDKVEKDSQEETHLVTQKDHEIALDEAKKSGHEEGRKQAFAEIKEGAEAAIAKLKNITEVLSKVEDLDLSELEKIMSNKILELSTDLSGKIIKALPAEFLKKINKFVTSLENIEGKIEIFVSEEDYKVLEKNKDIRKEIENLNILSLNSLQIGELEFRVNGVKILNNIKKVN